MERPGELLRRARESRRAAPYVRAEAEPAPPRVRSEIPGGHSSYTALMRSHDRVRTQHLTVQGGTYRA